MVQEEIQIRFCQARRNAIKSSRTYGPGRVETAETPVLADVDEREASIQLILEGI